MLAIMRTRIKICCIASIDEAQLAIAAGADALGLVAAMPSGPGVIPDARIAQIAAWTPPPVSTFLLTAETTAARIAGHIAATQPTTVQIVSHIDPRELAELARLVPHVKRVQVIHVEGDDALDLIPAYAPHVHAFLLDSGRPCGAVPNWAAPAAPTTGPSARASCAPAPCPCSWPAASTPAMWPRPCARYAPTASTCARACAPMATSIS